MRTKLTFITFLVVVTQSVFAVNERAFMADGPFGSFYESFGINARIDGSAENFALNKNKLLQLGIRNIRVGTGIQNVRPIDSTTCKRIRELGASGIHSTLLWREFQTWDQLLSTTKSLLPNVVAVEGPNESDMGSENFTYNGETFPIGARKYQHDLYSIIKGDQQTKSLHVILTTVSWGMKYQDPYTVNGVQYPGLGNMETYSGGLNMDYGNMHAYTANSDAPGSAMNSWHVYYARKTAPTLPLMATEGGYNTAINADGGISEWAHARYVPRWFLEQYLWGVVRNFSYKLVDNGQNDSLTEDMYGLVRYDGTNKPAFECIKNMLDILRDPGASFTPESLDYQLQGNFPSTVHHILLQKRNRTFYLILWNDIKNSNGRSSDIKQNDVPATVSLRTSINKVNTFLPLVSSTAQTSFQAPSSISISIPDNPLILELIPATTGVSRESTKQSRSKPTLKVSPHSMSHVVLQRTHPSTNSGLYDLRGSSLVSKPGESSQLIGKAGAQ